MSAHLPEEALRGEHELEHPGARPAVIGLHAGY